MSSLPADPETPGNVWCEDCQQSLASSRASAHLVSKKHGENCLSQSSSRGEVAAPKKGVAVTRDATHDEPRKKKKTAAAIPKKKVEDRPASDNETESEEDEEGEKASSRPPRGNKSSLTKSAPRAPAHGLPADPEKKGHFWCGICSVSLSPGQADVHLNTDRHLSNSLKVLSSSMNKMRVSTP